MKPSSFIRKTLKIAAWTLMAVVLAVVAVVSVLYSSWGQEGIRNFLVAKLNEGGMEFRLDKFTLRFPIQLTLEGLAMATPAGERIAAGKLDADVMVLPFLRGEAGIAQASLADASFTIGTPDSAMYLTLAAPKLALKDASVGLLTMDIDVADAALEGARVGMIINPDTTAADTTAAAQTAMKIDLHRLRIDDLQYTMRMLPTIDSLSAAMARADIKELTVDLTRQRIALASLLGTGLAAAYIAPDSATVAATPVVPTDTATAAAPWTIEIDTIGFSSSQALYTTRGIEPTAGLDFAYIQVDSLDLAVSHFYNRAAEVRVPLRVSATERCGVRLTAAGTLAVSEEGTRLDSFNITTPRATAIAFSALIGMGDMTTDPSTALMLRADGALAAADARLMFPLATPYLAAMGRDAKIYLKADVDGTAGALRIADLSVAAGANARLKASGTLRNVFSATGPEGNLAIRGALLDMNPLKNALLDKQMAEQVAIPRTTFDGKVDMSGGHLKGTLTAIADDGKISLDADWRQKARDYTVDLDLDKFPVNAFMPLLGVGQITARLDATGHGYDPFSPEMSLDASLAVDRAVYQGYDYRGITAKAHIADGTAAIDLKSANPNVQADISATGNLSGNTYDWTATVDGRYIDLHALGFAPDEATLATTLSGTASITPAANEIAAKLTLGTLTYKTALSTLSLSDIFATLNANDSTTNATLRNGDMMAFISSEVPLDTLMGRFAATSATIDTLMSRRVINVEDIQRALPPFNLDLTAGPKNALNDIFAESRMAFRSLHVTADNDSSLSMGATMLSLTSPSMRLDTITFDLAQYGPRLIFDGKIENRPGTFDEWAHVNLNGYLADNLLGLQIAQQNIRGQEGYNVGIELELADSTATLRLDPTDPTIAYMPWTVNEGNFVSWNFYHKHIDADLHMHSSTSSLAIYTEHTDGADDIQEDIVVDITDIQLADWIKINPFAPAIDGSLSANVRVGAEGHNIRGDGTVTLANLTYGKQRVGTFESTVKVDTDLAGRINALADLSVDGHKSITLSGALNDSTAASPLALDLEMISFPLATANPFLPPGLGSLSGVLNGSMNVSGEMDSPKLDGWLQFDSTAVTVDMIAASYPFNDVKIPVEQNVVRFDNFTISGVNDNPLAVNGTVDLSNFANPGVDLKLSASNFQLCNTKKAAKGADIYGKGYIDLSATAKGNMSFMAVDASLSVLAGTNITYVMPEAENMIAAQQNVDLVKFVNFADSAAVAGADSVAESTMAMLLQASLTIQSGSTINVDLSTNGRNRVSLQPDGTVDFSMQPFGEPRLTGRLNIPKGFVRYTPPLLSEKLFNFQDNSYVSFNGNMMNPTLNIHAVDVLKANVTQTGQNSRLVNFNVLLSVTGTLDNMNVVFDLTTEDDVTVANELQSMSAEQRANQAMNMLLYNIYSGPGTTGDSNLSGNALYSFLTSQLNNWAANTIKGVDLTFGIDQYDRTYNGSTSQTTSYSYQVSKSLFNDRFKIVVGGNYSTDANADENFSQNLIKDISFEYFLNKTQTMYVKLFRHTGYESILEGEITRTGVGFVYKRKIGSLRRLFGRLGRKKTAVETPAASEVKPSETSSENESK